jgi:hypothetical protein
MKRWKLLVGVLVLSGVIVAVAVWPREIDFATLKPEDVARVEVDLHLFDCDGNFQGFISYGTDDRAVIDALVPLLAKATPGMGDKCGDIGFLGFVTNGERYCRLRLSPGSDTAYYGFTAARKGSYRIPRREFLALMERAGVDDLQLVPEERGLRVPEKDEKPADPAGPRVWW